MYINDVSILYYACAGGLGLLIGSFINWCNYKLFVNGNKCNIIYCFIIFL